MRTKKIKKLALGKNTIVDLNLMYMDSVYGGGTITCVSCPCTPPPTLVRTYCFTDCATNCPECPPDPSVGIC